LVPEYKAFHWEAYIRVPEAGAVPV